MRNRFSKGPTVIRCEVSETDQSYNPQMEMTTDLLNYEICINGLN